MSYCVQCGMSIPDGQNVCSMCYGCFQESNHAVSVKIETPLIDDSSGLL